MFLPTRNQIAYAVDDHRVTTATGEVLYRFNVTLVRVQRVEEFVKMHLQRTLRTPKLLRVRQYAQANSLDEGSVRKFCRSALGAFYGAATVTEDKATWRLPEDIPANIVLLGQLAQVDRSVPAADLIMVALTSGQGGRGSTISELAKRLDLNMSTARSAVYRLKKAGLIVEAGRGKVKLANKE